MSLPTPPSPPHYVESERTAILERDLYHLDQRMTATLATVDTLGRRVHALSERIQRAETVLDQSIRDIAEVNTATSHLRSKIPDIEAVLKVLRWVTEGGKYLLGLGLVLGAVTGKLSLDALAKIFGG